MAKISNRFWFMLHGWVSLPIWLLFCFICLTGTIAVLSHEITWLTNPASRALNPNDLPEKPVSELMTIVETAYPSAAVTGAMTLESYLVNVVMFSDADKPFAMAYVNQYTGEIQQINEGMTFIGFIRSLHAWLLFPWQSSYSLGYYLVCSMALFMLASLVTGLIVYKRFWRSFFAPKLRISQGKKTLLADLHKLSGVWSIWFIAIMAVTGLWYLVQAIFWHADIDIEPHAPLVAAEQLPFVQKSDMKPAVPNVSLTQALTLAQTRFPNFQPSYVMQPEHNRGMYHLSGSGDHIFYDQYSYNLSINPWTGEVASATSPETMTGMQTLMHIADPLHYGTLGGIWTKIIWFIFGLILSGMSITGFMMWGLRNLRAFKNASVANTATDLLEEGY
ncbi:PepSY-associated TM helix domain-containing protein [Shewanella baltica]|uniref:PepSY-associated TM helix domain-containing protein n=1 Tax=Shewanella baltica TaxID=62322 RepID=UPI0001531CA8|nr:PepSY-associated TM helix domain-containing protein [Shewanella baltica]ACK46626.1 PepSY-associated TM helix domain protein [Shewanella baltica OS223]MCS6113220.1 PepSY domain-containing protein [Shewanella baltica]UVW64075.1 PepSY domain-containing protein [Shewanella baltica]HCE51230.1 PepSY domain-containing protein [Shewanella baltica]